MTNDPTPLTDQRKPRETPEEVVFRWWWKNIADTKVVAGEPSTKEMTPTGPRAELRRAKTLEEVVFVPLFHKLRHDLRETKWYRRDPNGVARLSLVAGVLGRVRYECETKDSRGRILTFPRQMSRGRSGPKTPPIVSVTRFRRLLQVGDSEEGLEELFQLTRRVVALLKKQINVTDLAQALYWWEPGVRKRWALDYYDNLDQNNLAKS